MQTISLKDNSTVLWDSNYLSVYDADKLFAELKTIDYIQPAFKMWGKPVSVPRLQNWMANSNVSNVDKTSAKFSALYQTQPQLEWSSSVLALKTKLEDDLDCSFDYVLINMYRDGNDYISYHSDKEASGDTNSIIASISLGGSRKFVLRHINWKEKSIPKQEYMLTHGSMIVMKDDVQKHWKHAIMKTKKDCGPRINLTFRIC